MCKMEIWFTLFNLAFIQAVLAQDLVVEIDRGRCPVGEKVLFNYAEAGSTASCTCMTNATTGLPPGQVQWIVESNGTEVAQGTTESTLKYPAQAGSAERYICVYVDNKGTYIGTGLRFQPLVFFGPTSGQDVVKFTRTDTGGDPGVFNRCPGSQLSFQCSIANILITPEPSFAIHLIRSTREEIAFSQIKDVVSNVDDSYSFTYIYTSVPAVDEFTVKCVVRNSVIADAIKLDQFNSSKFTEVTPESSIKIKVQEPPNSPPLITVNNAKIEDGVVEQVLENTALSVVCEVDGGVPAVTSVTLTCGTKVNTQPGTRSSLQFNADRSPARSNCTCAAEHVTGCYTLITSIVLEVVYETRILNFTANGQSLSVSLERGDRVTFECIAEGSPIPEMSLVRESEDSKPLVSGISTHLSHVLQNTQCLGTDRYYCVADNGIEPFLPEQRFVDVKVACSLELQDADLNDKEYTTTPGQDLSIQIPVRGYPGPTTFKLAVNKGQFLQVVNTTRYTVTYQSGSTGEAPTPLGTVTLVLLKVAVDDPVPYKLTISSGKGTDLVYSFSVHEAEDEPNVVPIAVGVAVGGLVLIIVIVVIIVVVVRRRSRNNVSRGDKWSGPSLAGLARSEASSGGGTASHISQSTGVSNAAYRKTQPRSREGSLDTSTTTTGTARSFYHPVGQPSSDENYPYQAVFKKVGGVHKPVSTSTTTGTSTTTVSELGSSYAPLDDEYVDPIEEPPLYDTIPENGISTRTYATATGLSSQPPTTRGPRRGYL